MSSGRYVEVLEFRVESTACRVLLCSELCVVRQLFRQSIKFVFDRPVDFFPGFYFNLYVWFGAQSC